MPANPDMVTHCDTIEGQAIEENFQFCLWKAGMEDARVASNAPIMCFCRTKQVLF
jgi:hypothetical protein